MTEIAFVRKTKGNLRLGDKTTPAQNPLYAVSASNTLPKRPRHFLSRLPKTFCSKGVTLA
jgi:hypothetical protein